MISKAMTTFWSKFQFQILLQFYRTSEKVTKGKLVMVMVKGLDKYQLFSTLTFWLLFCFFMIEIQAYRYKCILA